MDLSNVTNSAGKPVAFRNPTTRQFDGYNITALSPGDTWYVNITNCDPHLLQPTVWSSHGAYTYDGSHWTFETADDSFWALNFVNQANIGKQFYMDVNDKASGALISRAVVTISG